MSTLPSFEISTSQNYEFHNLPCVRKFFNRVSKVIRDCIGFALLRSVIGLENLRYSLNQSDSNYNQYKLGTRVSPRFKQFGCFNSESSWLLKAFLGLFRFGFNDSQSKSALLEITK